MEYISANVSIRTSGFHHGYGVDINPDPRLSISSPHALSLGILGKEFTFKDRYKFHKKAIHNVANTETVHTIEPFGFWCVLTAPLSIMKRY